METQKVILWVVVAVLLVALLFLASGYKINISKSGGLVSGAMPEKCKLPAGQDVASWKEHLGHHAETQECLKYFP